MGVSPSTWLPPNSEREVGLGFYATSTPGLPASIKQQPDDFVVREISRYPLPVPDGSYTILRVVSRDWEQHELAARIASVLGIPRHAIAWAGTKDRRAVAERLFSYRGPPPNTPLEIPGVDFREAYRARDGLSLGFHYGYSFSIRLSGDRSNGAEAIQSLGATRDAIRSLGWVPNLFGLQRFGEVRPITHLVGQAIVRGNLAGAVELYLAQILPDGDGFGDVARLSYGEHHDPVRALKEFPPSFRFERILLDHLARGHSPARALGGLSRELRQLFVHAYQSWLFNRWATKRLEAALPCEAPTSGDYLVRRAADGTVARSGGVPVSADNLSEGRDLVGRGRATVAGPLVGHETPELEGDAGKLFESLLEEEGIRRRDFAVPNMPSIASAGTWRPLVISAPPIAIEAPVGESIRLSFSLPKGAYATVLLREYLKNGAAESRS